MEKPLSPPEPRRILIRIGGLGGDHAMRKIWLSRLRDGGAQIISDGRFGIEAEMNEPMIKDVFGLTVAWENGTPQLTGTVTSDITPNTPTIYIPRKPEMF